MTQTGGQIAGIFCLTILLVATGNQHAGFGSVECAIGAVATIRAPVSSINMAPALSRASSSSLKPSTSFKGGDLSQSSMMGAALSITNDAPTSPKNRQAAGRLQIIRGSFDATNDASSFGSLASSGFSSPIGSPKSGGSSSASSSSNLSKFSNLFKSNAVPPNCYIDILARLQRWQAKYQVLVRSGKVGTKNPADLIAQEVDKLDDELAREECTAGQVPQFSPQKAASKAIDWVYKALKKLIKNLEKSVREVTNEQKSQLKARSEQEIYIGDQYDGQDAFPEEQQLPTLVDELPSKVQIGSNLNEAETHLNAAAANDDSAYLWTSDEQTEQELGQTKAILMRTASNLLDKEIKSVAENAAYSVVSDYVNFDSKAFDALKFVKPILNLVTNSRSSPLALQYLLDLDLRTALSIINRSQPAGFLLCAPQDKDLTC